jgi:hypothetical protein
MTVRPKDMARSSLATSRRRGPIPMPITPPVAAPTTSSRRQPGNGHSVSSEETTQRLLLRVLTEMQTLGKQIATLSEEVTHVRGLINGDANMSEEQTEKPADTKAPVETPTETPRETRSRGAK